MPVNRQEKLRQILARLEKQYGRPSLLGGEEPLLDQLLFLVLQDGVGREAAEKSLQSLRKEFVDWNEVRVSSIAEIRSAMKMPDAETAEQKARAVRGLLAKLFADKNKISLAFLEELDAERSQRFLTALPGVQPWVAATVLVLLMKEPKFDGNPSLQRLARRSVFTERGMTPKRIAEALDEMFAGKDLPRIYSLLVHHAETVCLAKTPACPECGVADLCPSNRAAKRAKATS
jgi:endonuclease III